MTTRASPYDEGRPSQGGPVVEKVPTYTDSSRLRRIPDDLRQRRSAGRRAPVLDCGHSDPLDCLYGHTDTTAAAGAPARWCCSALDYAQIAHCSRQGWHCGLTVSCARRALAGAAP